MRLLSRIYKIGQAKANNLVDDFENPDFMLDQVYRDKQRQIEELKESVITCMASERLTRVQLEREEKEKDRWEKQAKEALSDKNEDLAIKALEKASAHEENARSLKKIWNQQKDDVQNLKTDFQKQMDQLTEHKHQCELLKAKHKLAQSKKSIHMTRHKLLTRQGEDHLMSRLATKIEQSCLEADAAHDLDLEFEKINQPTGKSHKVEPSLEIKQKLADLSAELKK